MAVVAEAGGVRWINDSKATNPHAADAALAAAESIVWIAGGLTKGADLTELISTHARRLTGVVLIGTDPDPYTSVLTAHAPEVPLVRIDPATGEDQATGASGPADETRRGEAIMRAAVTAARELASDGDTVLLAPAAASMDQFLNYGTRGALFAAAVQDQVS